MKRFKGKMEQVSANACSEWEQRVTDGERMSVHGRFMLYLDVCFDWFILTTYIR